MNLTPGVETPELVPIDSIQPWPGNPRTHDIPTIADSLARHGQFRPVAAQARSRLIIYGHGTVEAAQSLGWTEIQCVFLDVDDDEAERILLLDNRANDLGGYDYAALLRQLRALDDLAGTGYTDDDLAKIEQQVAGESPDALLRSLDDAPGTQAAADVRNIILPYDTAVYDQMVEALGKLRFELDLETNAETVKVLVIQALGDIQ